MSRSRIRWGTLQHLRLILWWKYYKRLYLRCCIGSGSYLAAWSKLSRGSRSEIFLGLLQNLGWSLSLISWKLEVLTNVIKNSILNVAGFLDPHCSWYHFLCNKFYRGWKNCHNESPFKHDLWMSRKKVQKRKGLYIRTVCFGATWNKNRLYPFSNLKKHFSQVSILKITYSHIHILFVFLIKKKQP